MRLPNPSSPKPRLSRAFFILIIAGLSVVLTHCKEAFDNAFSRRSGDGSQSLILENPPELPDGALYQISLPEKWSDLVIYAHGYVNPQRELALPDDFINGRSVAGIINKLGMAYATTSYRANGLVGPEAINDIQQLVNKFVERNGQPNHIYLVGVSQGAMITALAIEQHPDIFNGGLAVCGPVGDFRQQLNYLGDFHVLFNYFYPESRTGGPSGVPGPVIENWLSENSSRRQQVANALIERPRDALTLLRVAGAPVQNESDRKEIERTVFNLLRYNVLATNNVIDRLNGLPYDNSQREYTGTGSARGDFILNREIARYQADSSALETIKNEFETSGDVSRPLVTMHTTGDQEVPYWHEPVYRGKVLREGSPVWHINLPVSGRYGHCNFTLTELLTGFALMVYKATLKDLIVPFDMFPNKRAEQAFLELANRQGISPVVRQQRIK